MISILTLKGRLKVAAVLIGYPVEALLFVLNGWTAFEQVNQTHIDGETLCWRLHDHALHLYGPDARNKLASWKITTTLGFGNLVHGMAEHGLIGTSDADTMGEFENVFAFEDHFIEPKFGNKNPPRQWKLSTLFVATTIAAIAISGFSRSGLNGVFNALYTSWFVFLGISCICIGIFHRMSGWLFLVTFGIICLPAGLFAFSYW